MRALRPRVLAASVAAVALVAVGAGACSEHVPDENKTPAPPASGDPDDVMCSPPAAQAQSGDVTVAGAGASKPLHALVNPFIGTGGIGFGAGSTYPGPLRPWGMIHPGPDTTSGGKDDNFQHCSGYASADEIVTGFSNTRVNGTGVPDYGAVSLMPTIGMTAAKTSQAASRAPMDKNSEVASAGYYAVTLADSQIHVELTATERVGIHRYTFPKGSDAVVLLDVGHTIPSTEIRDGSIAWDAAKGELTGFAQLYGGLSGRGGVDIYFAARFDKPVVKAGTWKAGALDDTAAAKTGGDTGAWVTFDTSTSSTVEAQIAISFVDAAHASKSLDAEGTTFDAARAAGEAAWDEALGKIVVEGRSDRDKSIFYTSLYHVMSMPNLASDVDGSYRGLDKQVHTTASGPDGKPGRYYTDFSLWDTYRTFHPFVDLVYPDAAAAMTQSLVLMGQQLGSMPRWPIGTVDSRCMVGESSAVVLADAAIKGVRGVDYAAGYELLAKSATTAVPGGGREAVADYVAKGYVPVESDGVATSDTIEYAYDDFALGALAGHLGKADEAKTFGARSHNWKNVYDASTGFVNGRKSDGSFEAQIPTAKHAWYAEGDAWQYTFAFPFDAEGLSDALGGRDVTLKKLEQFFTRSACAPQVPGFPAVYYWQGNEPDVGAAWTFAALDDGARAARWSRWILATQFGDGPDGVPGNDDGGTMAAWYLFGAMGFFPIPATTTYLLGSPIFPKVTVHLPGGDFVVEAPATSPSVMYPTSIALGGARLARPRIDHADVAKGGTLHFDLSDSP